MLLHRSFTWRSSNRSFRNFLYNYRSGLAKYPWMLSHVKLLRKKHHENRFNSRPPVRALRQSQIRVRHTLRTYWLIKLNCPPVAINHGRFIRNDGFLNLFFFWNYVLHLIPLLSFVLFARVFTCAILFSNIVSGVYLFRVCFSILHSEVLVGVSIPLFCCVCCFLNFVFKFGLFGLWCLHAFVCYSSMWFVS
jgi:hypothetical protein